MIQGLWRPNPSVDACLIDLPFPAGPAPVVSVILDFDLC